jgi:GT2 family glycosyltransferase
VLAQDYPELEVVVVDNASSDETRDILRQFEGRVRLVFNLDNRGFAAGQNQAIGHCDTDWILTLNPDVRLGPEFVRRLVEAGEADANVGSVCGKLLAMREDFRLPEKPVFDSTGIYMTPNLRHLDRGSRLPDEGQYERVEYVFGGTGAACLYRRAMMEDIAVDGEFFDSDFFAYREDADVAWRAQLAGWKCVYVPDVVAYHVRSVLPSNRSSVPAVLNMHSVKNRWLLRIKNMTGDLYRRHWLAITMRDLAVIGGCVLGEWRSLPAFGFVLRNWRRIWRKREQVMRRRRATDEYMAAWFAWTPVSMPAATGTAARLVERTAAR